MDINAEFGDIGNAKDNEGGSYIKEPQVLVVTVNKIEFSAPDVKPYMEVEFKTEDGRTNKHRFRRAEKEQSEKANEVRTSIIKKLFSNAGIDLSKTKGDVAIQQIIGKQIKALFRKADYVTIDKNNNAKPIIKQKIEYAWSGKLNDNLVSKESDYYKPLDAYNTTKFQKDLEEWARRQSSGTPSDSSGQPATKSDDLPF